MARSLLPAIDAQRVDAAMNRAPAPSPAVLSIGPHWGDRNHPAASPQPATSPATTACIASFSFTFASALHWSLVALGKAS